jgi:hypothetical protein
MLAMENSSIGPIPGCQLRPELFAPTYLPTHLPQSTADAARSVPQVREPFRDTLMRLSPCVLIPRLRGRKWAPARFSAAYPPTTAAANNAFYSMDLALNLVIHW